MADSKKQFVIIDANALIHRSYHALPVLTDKLGNPTHAIYGFTSVLIKLLEDFRPDYLVAAFDLPAPTFRHKQYADYKGTRSKTPDDLIDQIPKIKKVLEAFDVPVLEMAGYEADDIIGTVSKQLLREKNIDSLIVTGDLDTLQLVDEHTKVFTPKKGIGEMMIYDTEAVHERFGLRPDQLKDYKGLVGDKSDNIPGVAGVGHKGASDLLQKYETLEGVYEALEADADKDEKDKTRAIKGALAKKLTEHKDTAFFSKELGTIMREVPIKVALKDAAWSSDFDTEAVSKELLQYGFRTLVERLGLGGQQDMFGDGKATSASQATYRVYTDPKTVITELGKQPLLTFGYNPNGKTGDAEHFAIGHDPGHVYKVPISDVDLFRSIFEDNEILKQAHESKAFIKLLQSKGIRLRGFDFHGYLAAWIIKPGLKTYDLAQYAPGIESDDELLLMIVRLMKARPKLEQELAKLELSKIHDQVEMPLVEVLAAIELRGMEVNVSALNKLSKELTTKVDALEKAIEEDAGVAFNTRSPKQLREILFEKLELPTKGIRKTPGGDLSTNEQELVKIKDLHPIVQNILDYRELFKLKSTYTDALPKYADTGSRIHTTLNQTGAVTGRLSSTEPNMQNIPIKTEWGKRIREAFVAPREQGYKFVGFDYAQAELHVVAHISQDPSLLEAFRNHEDIHTITASEVNGVARDEVTPEMRRVAKVFNFGVIYGLSASGITQQTDLTRDEGQAFIDAYFVKFPKIRKYIDDTIEFAKKHGYVATLLGRRRYLPGIKTGAYQARAAAEREAINMPVQGTVGDFMKLAMIKLYNDLIRTDKNDEIHMVMQIHDELIFEIKEDKIDEYTKKITSIMEGIFELDAPLRVDAHVGDNWGELK